MGKQWAAGVWNHTTQQQQGWYAEKDGVGGIRWFPKVASRL